MAHRKLSHDEVRSVLDGVHKVLKRRDITQPVVMRFAAVAEPQLCYERREVSPGKYEWVAVPC
jgi:hypothetical protein